MGRKVLIEAAVLVLQHAPPWSCVDQKTSSRRSLFAEACSACVGIRETLGGGMSPRVRTALARGATYGLVWAIGIPLIRLIRQKSVVEALSDGATMGAVMFLGAFCLAFFFPSFGRRPPQNLN